MATSSSYDWDDDDSSPGTSRGRRPPSAVAREKEKVIAEKTKQLPEDFQVNFTNEDGS